MRGGQQQNNPANPSLDVFLLLAFVVGIAIVLWYFFSAQIAGFVFPLEAEIAAISWLIRRMIN